MRTVWKHQIQPAIAVVSLIFFLSLLLSDRGSLESLSRRHRTDIRPLFSQVQPNARHKFQFVPIGHEAHHRRAQRHLLTTTEVPAGEREDGDDDDEGDSRNLKPSHHQAAFRNESLAEHSNLVGGSSECVHTRQHPGKNDSCSFVKSIPQCSSGTLVEYTHIFYCFFSGSRILAYSALGIWLIVLFYMLGNTAADFFCLSIAKLAELMNLSPTLAGVTLLPLGNGAPDVFASITAFVGAGQGQVGLNSVLGGATFVSSVVAGSVSLVIAGSGADVHLDRRCFLRDIGFFLFTLAVLTSILFVGKIHFLGAVGYLCIYGAYAVTVAVVEVWSAKGYKSSSSQEQAMQPLLSDAPAGGVDPLPQWRWAPHVAIYSQQSRLDRPPSLDGRPLWGNEEQELGPKFKKLLRRLGSILAWPLTIPRLLTIPQVGSEDGWSKCYAVCSATFALPFLAMVWDGKDNGPFGSAWKEYVLALVVGICLGGISLFTLKREPQGRFLLPWAAGGFIMSIVWFYVIANELVAALVALGVVLEIDPAILGLTVLAWGNSIGDLMSNLFLVKQGTREQEQIAFAGCYAGPMFNTLVGVGLSLVFASWKAYPAAYVIPNDDSLFWTMAFLVTGLIWALVILLYNGMRPTKLFGVGLLVLYLSFLSLRLAFALGVSPNLIIQTRALLSN